MAAHITPSSHRYASMGSLPCLCCWALPGSQIAETSAQPCEPSEHGSPAVSRPLRKLTPADSPRSTLFRPSRPNSEAVLFLQHIGQQWLPPAARRGVLHPRAALQQRQRMRVASGRRMRPCNGGCPCACASPPRVVQRELNTQRATRRDATRAPPRRHAAAPRARAVRGDGAGGLQGHHD